MTRAPSGAVDRETGLVQLTTTIYRVPYPFEMWAQLHEGEVGVVGRCAVLSFGAAHAIALRGCARSPHIYAVQAYMRCKIAYMRCKYMHRLYRAAGMYPPPHMTYMYPPPHMTCLAYIRCKYMHRMYAMHVFRQPCTHSRILAYWQRQRHAEADAQEEILRCSLIPVHGRDSKQRLLAAVHDFAKVCLRLCKPRNVGTRAFCPAADQPGMSLYLPPCLLRATPLCRHQIRSHTTAPNCNGKRATATDGTRGRIPVSDRVIVVCIMVQCVVGYDFAQRLNHQFTIREDQRELHVCKHVFIKRPVITFSLRLLPHLLTTAVTRSSV